MTTITVPELTETEGKLNERRAKLHDIFAEAGPEMDMTKVKSIDGDSAAKVEAIRTLNTEIDELAAKAEGLRTLRKGAENAAARPEHVEDGAPTKGTFADQVIASGVLTNKGTKANIDVDLKTLMSTSAGWAPTPINNGKVVDYATRPIELVDIIPTTTTGQTGSVTYWEETTFTNNAAETTEGAAVANESALALTERTATIAKISALLPVTDEQLEDEERVPGYLNNRLPFMIRQRLSNQIAAGNGTPPNLRGILNVSTIQTQAKASDPTPDAVYKGMIKVRTTGAAVPDAFVVNPKDWQDIRLLRTADGIYIWGSPSEAGPDRIWGLRAVLAQAMSENTGVVGDFANFSELAIRKNVEVDVGLNADDFTKGRQTFRAQMRAALIWYRPTAFCQITGI